MAPLIGLILIIAAGIGGLTYWLMSLYAGGSRIRDRLQLDSPNIAAANRSPFDLRESLQKIGSACAKPFMPSTRQKQSALKQNLAKAGIYNPNAMRLLAGCKLILLATGLSLGYSLGNLGGAVFLGLSLGGLFGYLTPVIWLKMRIKSHQLNLTFSLPDALDLLVVCVEAGLTIDAAIQRVGQEMILSHPALSRELGITHMETRVGVSRAEAMKNMAARTQNAPIQSLVAMLVQADRFGTSIAHSLRIYSEGLRSKRQQQAEERAAKASVKMTFPMVLFIFPATFIVIGGPPILHMMGSAFFK